jgi:hypothetical protein
VKGHSQYVCLDFLHHQKPDLIVVILPGRYFFVTQFPDNGMPEAVGPKVSTSLLKGRTRPPQIWNGFFFFFFDKLILLVS